MDLLLQNPDHSGGLFWSKVKLMSFCSALSLAAWLFALNPEAAEAMFCIGFL